MPELINYDFYFFFPEGKKVGFTLNDRAQYICQYICSSIYMFINVPEENIQSKLIIVYVSKTKMLVQASAHKNSQYRTIDYEKHKK